MLVGISKNIGALKVSFLEKSHLKMETSQHFLRQTGSGSNWAILLRELGNAEHALPFQMLHPQFCDLPQLLGFTLAA